MNTAQDAYKLPDDGYYRVINFSGGRSSGFMLHQLLKYNDGLPANTEVIFNNTGKEREETLNFINEVSIRWSVPITWLEYHWNENAKGGKEDLKHVHKVVNYQTASRKGEPFEQMIRSTNWLPTVVSRKCTTVLKIDSKRFYLARELGISKNKIRQLIGFRYDEPKRVHRSLLKDCDIEFPMFYAKHTRDHVMSFWEQNDFDLEIPSILGNCDLCFMKGKKKIVETMRQNPELADWWIEMETRQVKIAKEKGLLNKLEMAQFFKDCTYEDLLKLSEQPVLDLGDLEDTPFEGCFCDI